MPDRAIRPLAIGRPIGCIVVSSLEIVLRTWHTGRNAAARQLNVPEDTRVIAAELRRTADDLTEAGIDVSWHVVEDTTPATGIVRQAAHRAANLIMMATHGRTGLARVLAGSVATDAIRHASVPVLTLRPAHLR